MREWKPGDVAMVTSQYGNEVVAVRCGPGPNMGWAYADALNGKPTQHWSSDPGGLHVVRPLLVIDPEDNEQVAELVQRMQVCQPGTLISGTVDKVQHALRSLIEPPKPEEPSGLGAVVEDANGEKWLRWEIVGRHPKPWTVAGSVKPNRAYDDINVVRILSEGVRP